MPEHWEDLMKSGGPISLEYNVVTGQVRDTTTKVAVGELPTYERADPRFEKLAAEEPDPEPAIVSIYRDPHQPSILTDT
jgi:hypothetical protein